jgi:hypothetical protein
VPAHDLDHLSLIRRTAGRRAGDFRNITEELGAYRGSPNSMNA